VIYTLRILHYIYYVTLHYVTYLYVIIFRVFSNQYDNSIIITSFNEKVLGETQTLCAGCSKVEPKIFARRRPLPGGTGQPKFNQLEIVTTFTYRPSLVKINACNFELLW